MSKYSSVIIGSGSYLPERILTNEELSKIVDTNDEWIVSRSGITQRHIVAEGELTSDLAFNAAQKAIEAAKLSPDQIDLIIVCTTTPDRSFPAVAVTVQAKLGIKNIPAFDVQAVCSGFIYGLTIADNFIKSGSVKNALVIGAESMSKLLDWQDRTTCVLFGDGAGAVVLKACDADKYEGIISSQIQSDGSYEDILYTDGGVSSTGTSGVMKMAGREVFKQAVDKMSSTIKEVLNNSKYTKEDLNWVIPHQANARILSAVATKLDLPPEKLVMTLDKHANTSAATIPLAIDHHVKLGLIKNNDLLVLAALGAGITWGGCLLRWNS
jgi:3-oxoacyl-[acyl-carrier-protein] synthase III